MSETPRVEWKAVLATRPGAYHRIERAGAHPTDEPIALVKDARHAQVIVLLPDLADALRGLLETEDEGCGAEEWERKATAARAVLDKLRKVKAPL